MLELLEYERRAGMLSFFVLWVGGCVCGLGELVGVVVGALVNVF